MTTTTRSPYDDSRIVSHTEAVSELPNQFGLFNQMGLYNTTGINTTFVKFDKDYHSTSLLPDATRGGKGFVKGKGKSSDSFVLDTSYFNYQDRVTAGEVQNYRQKGKDTDTLAETVDNVVADKLLLGRQAFDQTMEYMKFAAATGVAKTPEGTTLFDAYSEFGVSQTTINFDLGNSASNITKHISDLKREVAANLKMGRPLSSLMLVVDKAFFDAYTSHSNVIDRWNQYVNQGVQRNRDGLQDFREWGAISVFEDRDLTLVEYNPEFDYAGSPLSVLGAGKGITVVPNMGAVNSMYRGWFAPADKISSANTQGQELYAYQYGDERDTFVDIEMESAPLFINTRPAATVAVDDGI